MSFRRLPPGWSFVAISALMKLLILATVYPQRPGIVSNPDTSTYTRPAQALLELGRFAVSVTRPEEPELNRTPGYPLILASCFRFFGPGLLAPAALNVLFSAGTGFLVALLALRLFGPSAARVAAAIVAFEPSGFHYSTVVLSDTPFTFLLVLALFLVVRGLGRTKGREAFFCAAGLALALAILVRPIAYYLPVGLAVLLVLASPRRRALAAVALLLAPVLLVGGWQVRNRLRGGTWLVSQQQKVMLYFCHAAYVESRVDGISTPAEMERYGFKEFLWRFGYVESARDVFGERKYEELHPESARLSVVELADRWYRRALAVLRAHPWWVLEEHVRGAFCLFLSPAAFLWAFGWGFLIPSPALYDAFCSGELLRVAGILAREHRGLFGLSAISLVPVVALYGLAMRGLRRAPRDASSAALLLTAIYLVLVSAMPNAVDDRYRVPVVAILAVFAGAGWGRAEPSAEQLPEPRVIPVDSSAR